MSPPSPANYDLDNPEDREDRRKHLELTAAIIGRMASTSAMFKGWSVTLAGAAFGVAAVRNNWYLFLLGLVGVAVFALLDTFYLSIEKKYRDLYEAIADNSAPPLSMKTSGLASNESNKSYRSASVWGFYAPLAAAGLVLLGFSLASDEPEKHDDHDRGHHSQVW